MKDLYSHPVLTLKAIAKKHKMKIEKAHENMLHFIERKFGSGLQSLFMMIHYDIELCIYRGKCVNIFIQSPGLFDFLIKNEVKTNQSIKELMDLCSLTEDIIGNKDGLIFVIHHKKQGINSLIYFLHFPNYEHGRVYMSMGENRVQSRDFKLSSLVDTDLPNVKTIYSTQSEKEMEIHHKLYMNLFFNLIYYNIVFPDKVINGVPSDLKEVGLRYTQNSNNYVISSHEKIIDRSGITPHFRIGHFAKLTSERYVNKKGQIIWVSESMVKGYNAKTII